MARPLAAAAAAALLTVSGAAGSPGQTPKRGGTVVIAAAAHLEPACLNPFVDACNPDYLENVLSGAFEVTPNGDFRPDLASAELVAKKPFTLRYHIRPEARWSDGRPVTARDFVFTDQAIRKLRPEDENLHLDWVRRVRALDAKTIDVDLRDRRADWRFLFDWVLPRHALAGEDLTQVWRDRIDNPKTGVSIGSGPFLVDRFEYGSQLVLRRNPRYWGPHTAYLDRLVARYTAPEDAAEALRQGRVDLIQPGPAILQAAARELRRERAPGIRVVSTLDSFWEHIEIRMAAGGNPALRNPRVRRALAYGIDRVAIARAVAELEGEPASQAEPLDSVVFPANSRDYRPSWKRYRYRPTEAQRLLEQAGCRQGPDRIYACNGERLAFRLGTSAGAERRRLTAELARAQLRRVGVEVTLEYYPPLVWAGVLKRGDFDLFQFGFGFDPSGPYDIFGCQRQYNFSGYCDRLMTRDLGLATRILDDARRVQLLRRIDARLATVVPALPLFQTRIPFAYDAAIRGIVPNAFGPFTWNAEDWWLDR